MAGTSLVMIGQGLILISKNAFVYMMTNRRNGTLYVGVTSDLVRRCHERRNGLLPGFTKRHGLKQLVYFELHDDIRAAIQREKTIKHWPRAWKGASFTRTIPIGGTCLTLSLETYPRAVRRGWPGRARP